MLPEHQRMSQVVHTQRNSKHLCHRGVTLVHLIYQMAQGHSSHEAIGFHIPAVRARIVMFDGIIHIYIYMYILGTAWVIYVCMYIFV